MKSRLRQHTVSQALNKLKRPRCCHYDTLQLWRNNNQKWSDTTGGKVLLKLPILRILLTFFLSSLVNIPLNVGDDLTQRKDNRLCDLFFFKLMLLMIKWWTSGSLFLFWPTAGQHVAGLRWRWTTLNCSVPGVSHHLRWNFSKSAMKRQRRMSSKK